MYYDFRMNTKLNIILLQIVYVYFLDIFYSKLHNITQFLSMQTSTLYPSKIKISQLKIEFHFCEINLLATLIFLQNLISFPKNILQFL